MSPYVTIYHKESGKAQLIYAASVQEFLATGDYVLEAPGAPEKPAELKKAELPSAGREQNRKPLEVEYEAHNPEAEAEEPKAEEPAKEEHKRPAPKRRPAAAE